MPAIFVERGLHLRVACDQNFSKLLFKLTGEKLQYTTLTHSVSGKRDLAASASKTVDFEGMTTGKVLLVVTSGLCNVVINGALIPVEPVETGATAIKQGALVLESSITSLTLTNPDVSASIEVQWELVGI